MSMASYGLYPVTTHRGVIVGGGEQDWLPRAPMGEGPSKPEMKRQDK